VIWRPTWRLQLAVVVVAAGLVTGLVVGHPAPVLLVTPLAVVLAAVVGATRTIPVTVSAALDRSHAQEGEEIAVTVLLRAASRVQVRVELDLPAGLTLVPDQDLGRLLGADVAHELVLRVRCDRWGNHEIGAPLLRARGPLGLVVATAVPSRRLLLQVFPGIETLRGLVGPRAPRASGGSTVARVRAPGFEFADLRPFTPGDRARDVNWRASARRGEVWVNQHHPERSTDVVLLVDALSDQMLLEAVRAASTLSQAYLAHRDRVGLITLGGFVRWIRPASGIRQTAVLFRELLDTAVVHNLADKDLRDIPPGVLPRRVLVLALSTLEDERFVSVVVDLAGRGIDLAVVELVPPDPVARRGDRIAGLGDRLWHLDRLARRDRLRSLGIAVAPWRDGEAMAVTVEEAARWRRQPQTSV
jgi:uncharacterized protein (DUF58 family)